MHNNSDFAILYTEDKAWVRESNTRNEEDKGNIAVAPTILGGAVPDAKEFRISADVASVKLTDSEAPKSANPPTDKGIDDGETHGKRNEGPRNPTTGLPDNGDNTAERIKESIHEEEEHSGEDTKDDKEEN